METISYKFSDLTSDDLENLGDAEYVHADDVEKEIEELTEERDGIQDDLDEANKKIEQLENHVISTDEIFAFAKWLDQNNIRVLRITETELEFKYEKFKNEIKIPEQ